MTDQLALTRQNRTNALTPNPNKAIRQQIPAFLNKLYSMVNDPANSELIRWSDQGDSFFVPNHERFGRELLPRFFKHGNFSSFVRQLNMYGFHKVPHLQQGVLQNETETELWQFVNPHFQRGQPDLLMLIQRKKAGAAANHAAGEDDDLDGPGAPHDIPGAGTIDLSSIAQSLASIKRHQSSISGDLKDLQQSNTALWQEALAARERHKKHQDTINRILKFLVGVFGAAANGANPASGIVQDPDDGEGGSSPSALVPRKRPRLMIENSSPTNSDIRGAAKGKEKAKSGRGSVVEDAVAWDAERSGVPMEVTSPAAAGTGRIAEMPSPMLDVHDNSSLWGDEAKSTGKIESVASTPGTIIPPTPYVAPATLGSQSYSNPPQGLALPNRYQSATSTATFPQSQVESSQAQSQFGVQNQTSATSSNAYPYLANTGVPQQPPNSSLDLSPTEQSAIQALLASPGGMQRMLAALNQPGGLPAIPPMTTLPPNVLTNPYPSYPPGQALPSFAIPDPSLYNAAQNQLIPAGSGPTGTFDNTFPGMAPSFSGLSNGAVTPEAMLSLLHGPGENGTGMEVAGPTDQELLNSMNAQTDALNKTYTDAAAINADVDGLQTSINNLIDQLGLDPAMFSKFQTDDTGLPPASGNLHAAAGNNSQPAVDFDAFLHQFAPPSVADPTYAGGASNMESLDGLHTFDDSGNAMAMDTNVYAPSGNTSGPLDQNFRRERLATASSSDARDDSITADDKTSTATRARSSKSKRKSTGDDAVGTSPGAEGSKQRKSTRRK